MRACVRGGVRRGTGAGTRYVGERNWVRLPAARARASHLLCACLLPISTLTCTFQPIHTSTAKYAKPPYVHQQPTPTAVRHSTAPPPQVYLYLLSLKGVKTDTTTRNKLFLNKGDDILNDTKTYTADWWRAPADRHYRLRPQDGRWEHY
mgnify:CR=1 FL=1